MDTYIKTLDADILAEILPRISTADLQAELARREDATIYVLDYGDSGELTFDRSLGPFHAPPVRIAIGGNTFVIAVKRRG